MAWQKCYLSCIAGWALTSTQEEMKEGRTVCLGEVLAMWWRTICHQQSSLNRAQSCTTHSMRTPPDLNGSAGQSQKETWLKICMKWNEMQILHPFTSVLSSKNLNVGHNLTKKEPLAYKIRTTTTTRNIQDDKLHLTLILPFSQIVTSFSSRVNSLKITHKHTLVSNRSWHCTWRWRTCGGAALSHDTINDCDPGSSKNKDCFSIPPLLPGWMMNPR